MEAQFNLLEFFYDCEELEAWLYECWLRLQTAALGRDLNHIQLNQHKHKVGLTDRLFIVVHEMKPKLAEIKICRQMRFMSHHH